MKFLAKNTIVAIVSMVFLIACSQKMKVDELLEYQGKYPDESAEEMEVVYSEDGKKNFVLFAPLLNKYYEESDTYVGYMDCPLGVTIISFDDDGEEQSILTADYAISEEMNRTMEARKNVVIKNLKKNETIETEQIIWDKNKRKIYSETEVRYTKSDGSVSIGDGFDADERFSKYSVRNPRGEIVADEY